MDKRLKNCNNIIQRYSNRKRVLCAVKNRQISFKVNGNYTLCTRRMIFMFANKDGGEVAMTLLLACFHHVIIFIDIHTVITIVTI